MCEPAQVRMLGRQNAKANIVSNPFVYIWYELCTLPKLYIPVDVIAIWCSACLRARPFADRYNGRKRVFQTTSRNVLIILAILLQSSSAAFADEPLREIEPNDSSRKAMPLPPGSVVIGKVHFTDGKDFFRMTFPKSGTAILELSGYPQDCSFQVGRAGFHKDADGNIGWHDGKPGQKIRHTFPVVGGRSGHVWVKLTSRVSSISTAKWGGVKTTKHGPWYVTPRPGTPSDPPAVHNGSPVKPPITYRLKLSMQGEPDSSDRGPSSIVRKNQQGTLLNFLKLAHGQNETGTLELAGADLTQKIKSAGFSKWRDNLFILPVSKFTNIGTAKGKDNAVMEGVTVTFQNGRKLHAMGMIQNGHVTFFSGRLGRK